MKNKPPVVDSWTPTELAYFAGLIDGEGHIGLNDSSYTSKAGVFINKSRARLEITNTDVRMVNWIADRFGGNSRPKVQTNKRAKPAFSWHCGGSEGIVLLLAVMPYLVVKRAQAEIFIQFVRLGRTGKRWSRVALNPEVYAARKSIVEAMHGLNRKGLSAVSNG